jgi:hypothetical protein
VEADCRAHSGRHHASDIARSFHYLMLSRNTTEGLRRTIASARFLARLPAHLRRPITVPEAREILRRRLDRRDADFLALVRRTVYAEPESPYRKLLAVAGCEYADLDRLVTQDGLDQALRALCRAGVYLTVEEFKGRRPTVRGGETIDVTPDRCRNPGLVGHLRGQSSGSRGPRTETVKTLEYLRDQAVDKCLVLDGRGGPWQLAHWDVPGGGLTALLTSSLSGTTPARWFSPVDPGDPGLHARYRWSARAVRWGSVLAGRPLPRPRHVPVDDPLPIARWMQDVLRAGGRPLLVGYSSAVVGLCQAARGAGVEIAGAQFTLDGEPLTRARLDVIRRSGADAVPTYATSEAGRTGDGCLRPLEVDEVHLESDLHALVQPGAGGARPGLPPDALLISSIRPSTAFILINVAMGDQAVVSERACGCPYQQLGWRTHLHGIRSFEKLTAAGMTFLDTDVIRVLEEVLPGRFGGIPSDYQLVEEEAPNGAPRIRLLVHPRVGPLPEDVVGQTFLEAIGRGSGAERIMSLVWRDAGLLRVERRPPVATETGKVLHLHAVSSERPAARSPERPAD